MRKIETTRRANGKPLTVVHFDGVGDFVTGARSEECPSREAYADHRNWFGKSIPGKFAGGKPSSWLGGVKSMAEAEALITKGWPEGRARANEAFAEVEVDVPEARTLTRRVRYADQGDEVMMDRYMTGQLDRTWRSMPREEEVGGHRIVTVYVGYGANAMVKGSDMFWGPAAATVLIDRLEASGVRVEAFGCKGSRAPNGSTSLQIVHLKEAHEPLVTDNLIATAHAAFGRIYGIGACTAMRGRLGSGMGSHVNAAALLEDAEASGAVPDPPDVLIEAVYSQAAAIRQVEESILKIEDKLGRELAL